jgi:hypothetical protein
MPKIMKTVFTAMLCCFFAYNADSQIWYNEGFETWVTNGQALEPQGWFTSNSFFPSTPTVEKVTDPHSGSFAVKLITQVRPNEVDPIGGLIVSSLPLEAKPEFVMGWYKFVSDGDTLSATIRLTRYDTATDTRVTVGLKTFEIFEGEDNYVQFAEMIEYTGTENPDTARIVFSFSDISLSSVAAFTLDDLMLGVPEGLKTAPYAARPLSPNPAAEQVSISPFSQSVSVSIYDASGRIVDRKTLLSGTRNFSTSALNNGVYVLSFLSAKNEVLGVEKLVIQH